MAEESQTKRATFEDAAFTLFAVLLVAQAVARVPVLLEEYLGISFGGQYLVASAALSGDTPLGSHVNTPQGTAYFAKAGSSGTQQGTFSPGTALVLQDGPTTVGGVRYWLVQDRARGTDGWVPESALVRDGVGGLNPATKIGSNVRALLDVDAWRVPGGVEKVATLAKGELGRLSDGPVTKNGSRWWLFDRAGTPDDGWVPEAALMLSTDTNWHVGSPVVAAHATDLFERAGGGRPVSFLTEGARATIVGGPAESGGAYWWLVKTENGTQGWVAEDALTIGGVQGWIRSALTTLLIIGILLMVILLGGIVYVTIRTNQIRAREAARIRASVPAAMQPKRNERWDKVLTHVHSDNPNDWRLAIIESDVMLDELVTRMGYRGMTLGDKLKQVSRGDIATIDAAWEAHRVRNQIAHAGSDYILTQREARRVVELYGSVFEEFKYI
jgi:hypothetical protein